MGFCVVVFCSNNLWGCDKPLFCCVVFCDRSGFAIISLGERKPFVLI